MLVNVFVNTLYFSGCEHGSSLFLPLRFQARELQRSFLSYSRSGILNKPFRFRCHISRGLNLTPDSALADSHFLGSILHKRRFRIKYAFCTLDFLTLSVTAMLAFGMQSLIDFLSAQKLVSFFDGTQIAPDNVFVDLCQLCSKTFERANIALNL